MKALNLNSQFNYDFFGSDHFEELHWGKLFINLFGTYYSNLRIKREYKVRDFINEIRKKFTVPDENVISIERDTRDEGIIKTVEVLLILKNGFCISIHRSGMFILYNSNINYNEVLEVVAMGDQFINPKDNPKRKINMIRKSNSGLELDSFDITPCDIELKTHYNDDFYDINHLINNSLIEKKNGLILLHGSYGTGKTYYLRHLINTIDREFVFFPLHMVEYISAPDFLPFIAENPNVVLILEDCESILVKRENGPHNSSALSTLLNIGDGLLADALKINVICTFNSQLTQIDEALLRKGRLIAKYEFKALERDKAQRLSDSLGQHVFIEKPMTVSEIYNLKEMSFETKKRKSIGFQN